MSTTEVHDLGDGYQLIISWSTYNDEFRALVYCGDSLVGKSSLMKSHTRAARWAKRRKRNHLKAHRLLTPVNDPKDTIGTS